EIRVLRVHVAECALASERALATGSGSGRGRARVADRTRHPGARLGRLGGARRQRCRIRASAHRLEAERSSTSCAPCRRERPRRGASTWAQEATRGFCDSRRTDWLPTGLCWLLQLARLVVACRPR